MNAWVCVLAGLMWGEKTRLHLLQNVNLFRPCLIGFILKKMAIGPGEASLHYSSQAAKKRVIPSSDAANLRLSFS